MSLYEQWRERQDAANKSAAERDRRLTDELLFLISRRGCGADFDERVNRLAALFAETRIGENSSVSVRVLLNTALNEPLLSSLGFALAERIVRLPSKRKADWELTLRFSIPGAGEKSRALASSAAMSLSEAAACLQAERIEQGISTLKVGDPPLASKKKAGL